MPSDNLGAKPSEVFDGCIETVQNVSQTFQFQMMNNVECFLASLPEDMQGRYKEMFETFFKQPLRRQIGRLNKTTSLLRKFQVQNSK